MNIRSLSQQIYAFIVEEIRVGNIQLGQKINENELLEKLPTSRTPIREALIQLASAGILENIPRKGFFVRQVSSETMREHYRVIALLDFYALKLAIPHLKEKDYRKMSDILDDLDAAIANQDHPAYHRLADSFHTCYYKLSGNNSLPGIIFDIRNQCLLTTYSSQDKGKLFALLRENNLEHRRMLELAKENRLEELEALLVSHWAKADTYL
ncbi:MAG: GntR family transcriptional regulator [Deltaproteobacteria bacterium]|nr:GntR family transcriptional regulator [Deltaproteobacteria bacterium]